jgi:hypothetical protein
LSYTKGIASTSFPLSESRTPALFIFLLYTELFRKSTKAATAVAINHQGIRLKLFLGNDPETRVFVHHFGEPATDQAFPFLHWAIAVGLFTHQPTRTALCGPPWKRLFNSHPHQPVLAPFLHLFLVCLPQQSVSCMKGDFVLTITDCVFLRIQNTAWHIVGTREIAVE